MLDIGQILNLVYFLIGLTLKYCTGTQYEASHSTALHILKALIA